LTPNCKIKIRNGVNELHSPLPNKTWVVAELEFQSMGARLKVDIKKEINLKNIN